MQCMKLDMDTSISSSKYGNNTRICARVGTLLDRPIFLVHFHSALNGNDNTGGPRRVTREEREREEREMRVEYKSALV
jgi:hypothetical protein